MAHHFSSHPTRLPSLDAAVPFSSTSRKLFSPFPPLSTCRPTWRLHRCEGLLNATASREGALWENPKSGKRLHPQSRAAEASPDLPLQAHPLHHAQRERLATTVLVRAPPPHPRPLFVGGRPSSASTPIVLPCRPFSLCGLCSMCRDTTSTASAPGRTSMATCRSSLSPSLSFDPCFF